MLRRALQVTASSVPKTAADSCPIRTRVATGPLIGTQRRLLSSEEAPRPPFPPFTRETALEKVRIARACVLGGRTSIELF